MLKMIVTIALLMMIATAVSAKSLMNKKMERAAKQAAENEDSDYWNDGEVKQITIEKKVPVFVEKIRHVPIVQKEYISVPRYITKPIYIQRSVPIIVPRHYHHYTEYHHMG